jgi:serine/threonine-protein kinase
MIDAAKAIWISFFMSILSAVIICFCFYFFIMPNLPPPPTWGIKKAQEQKIEVPNFIGVHPNQAKITASEKGLLLVIAGEEVNENFPEGVIVRQTPLPGSLLPPQGVINVYIAKKEKKEEMVKVPFVKGLSLAIAQNQIINAGLTIEKIENINSDSIPKGHVIKTLPPEGSSVLKNTPITIFVSSGANLVVVPNLIGKYFPSALTLLEERGLDAGKVRRVLSTEHPENMIIDQNPRPGEKVPKGSKVDIVVATVEEEIKY